MNLVKVSAKVERRIEDLKQSDKYGRLTAQKAGSIIEGLKSGFDAESREPVGTFTKYGEKRIKNCIKYDIGRGFRLITLMKDSMILVPFLGTHDECQRWLEKNTQTKEFAVGRGEVFNRAFFEKYIEEDDSTDISGNTYEDEYSNNLSEQDLRIVFRGLIQAAEKKTGRTAFNVY